jgi:hypothetical protein
LVLEGELLEFIELLGSIELLEFLGLLELVESIEFVGFWETKLNAITKTHFDYAQGRRKGENTKKAG